MSTAERWNLVYVRRSQLATPKKDKSIYIKHFKCNKETNIKIKTLAVEREMTEEKLLLSIFEEYLVKLEKKQNKKE
jgi:hypothetical protein